MRISDIKHELHSRLPSILPELFPHGCIKGQQFRVGNLQGDKGESLVIEMQGPKAGLWQDFATGDSGDILHLWGQAKGIDPKQQFAEVLEDVKRYLGVDGERHSCSTNDEHHGDCSISAINGYPAPSASWDYTDAAGQLMASVYRYEIGKGKKQFRPYDHRGKKWRMPSPRPLYNLPGIAAADEIIICEGEKAAQALIGQGYTASSAMGGANAPLDKADWSPLKGKRVIIWPDNDDAGMAYGRKLTKYLASIAKDVRCIMPHSGWAEKYDAADAVADDLNVSAIIDGASDRLQHYEHSPLIADWSATQYAGEPPEQQFLVEGTLPLGVACLLAAMGDTGKGMLSLHLALQVATGENRPAYSPGMESLGNRVTSFGKAVVFTAEDDQAEVHRRLKRLDPDQHYLGYADRLFIVPLPNAGGPLPIVQAAEKGKPNITDAYRELEEQLCAMEDLRLIVFDPLSSFAQADITADPATGSLLTGLLAGLATKTGACVLISHHMRKPQGNIPIQSAAQARDAIRGTSALVDGVRCAYAIWPYAPREQASIFKLLGEKPEPNALFQGAVVKSNGKADRTVRTFWRNDTGLLVDVTALTRKQEVGSEEMITVLRDAVARAAKNGYPFTKTGGNGVYQNRHRLPEQLRGIGRDKLEMMVGDLLDEKKIVKGRTKGSTIEKWLDVPEGEFAKGNGVLADGAEEVSEYDKH